MNKIIELSKKEKHLVSGGIQKLTKYVIDGSNGDCGNRIRGRSIVKLNSCYSVHPDSCRHEHATPSAGEVIIDMLTSPYFWLPLTIGGVLAFGTAMLQGIKSNTIDGIGIDGDVV